MEVLIQGTISALGYLEDGIYYQEPDCYETIRDLIRFLRTDNNLLLARKICGERNIIENDLIPIIKSDDLKDNMFDITLRLLANLTQPAIVSLQGKQPEDRDEWQTYWTLEENLRRAKLAFADVKFFAVLKKKLEKYFIETDWEDRLEEDRLVMERIIVLLRYIFSISPTEGDGRRTAAESNSHDRVIMAFLESGIDKVLTHIAMQSKEQEFHLSIMVIFALILKEHKPADIASAGRGRTQAEKEQAEEELRQVVETEKAKLNAKRRKILASRHPRFFGSYVVKGLSAVNKEKDLVVLKPLKDVNELTFQAERKHQKTIAKNRRPFDAELKTHLSSMELRIKLKECLEEDLSKCFNRLMKSSREMAFDTRLSAGQKNADMYFFLLMRFMLEYTRLAGRPSSIVSVCLPVESFHHIQVHLDNYLESAAALNKEAKSFGLRAQHALSAYKELILFHLHLLDKGSPEEKEFAKRTCYHILTVEEYREMGIVLIRKFKPGFLSKTFLRELILATHHYFRLLERSVKAGQLTTVTKRSKIRRARRKKTPEDTFGPEPLPAVVDSMSAEDMEKKWSQIADEIKDIILGNVEPSVDQIPINSLLDVQEEQHQKFAMLKIQRAMRECRPKDAMGLYRASRAMWSTEGIFGDPENSTDQQVEEIREIFFTDLKEVADEFLKAEIAAQKKFASESMIDGEDEEDLYSSEEEEEARYETKEVKFDLQEYVNFYARTDVLRWYVFLLKDFATNSAEVNKALVKLLHRVAFDLKMQTRLYQLSLFRIFAEVRKHLDGMTMEEMKKHPLFELYTFGYHLLKRFFLFYKEKGDMLAPELLFWKGSKECFEIENGDGYEESKHQKDPYSWSEELENELRSLYNEYRDMDERPEGMDVLDFIEPNLSRPRTRKQILKKMKEFALDPLGAKANKGSIMDRNFPIIRAKELIEQYNELADKSQDMVDFLRTNLAETHGEFSRQKIIKQISYLGIVYEKKKPVSKNYKWSDGLRTELAALKEQYYEMDAEDQELVTLLDYCARRLSEKKPRRQIEQELIALGAAIEPTEKRRKRVSKPRSASASDSEPDDVLEPRGLSSSASNQLKKAPSEDSDADLDLEDETYHHDEGKEPSAETTAQSTRDFESEQHRPASRSSETNVEEVDESVVSPGNNPDHTGRIKKRRVITSSDEEDNAEEAVDKEDKQDDEATSELPIVTKPKRSRLVLSDSDED
nr:Timeless protein and Timeless C-terminal domain containing protein [Haemonchus contortus]